METGAPTTTIRVKTSTRAQLGDYGRRHDMTADEVVLAGLRALEWEHQRRQAQHEALRLRHDPEYLAEVRAVQEDLHGDGRHAAG